MNCSFLSLSGCPSLLCLHLSVLTVACYAFLSLSFSSIANPSKISLLVPPRSLRYLVPFLLESGCKGRAFPHSLQIFSHLFSEIFTLGLILSMIRL